jgi:hypothetical protein
MGGCQSCRSRRGIRRRRTADPYVLDTYLMEHCQRREVSLPVMTLNLCWIAVRRASGYFPRHHASRSPLVLTTSSKTVAHRSSVPVLSDRQCRSTACPWHSSQNSPKSSSALNIHRTLLRRNSRSASPIRRPGTASRHQPCDWAANAGLWRSRMMRGGVGMVRETASHRRRWARLCESKEGRYAGCVPRRPMPINPL